jgi:uncharacterized protein YaiI (UPF0178 family)
VSWVVDAANVIGARPDGWWRDRADATRRLHDALARFARERGEAVTMVLDGPAPELAEGAPGVAVVAAPRPRRDGADDEIVRLVAAAPAAGGIRVVTSDVALAKRVRALGAAVEGAGSFRRRLDV